MRIGAGTTRGVHDDGVAAGCGGAGTVTACTARASIRHTPPTGLKIVANEICSGAVLNTPARRSDPSGANSGGSLALLVTPTELSVAAPLVDSVLNEVLPVTPSVPPTVALLVTPTELSVAAPLVDSVLSEVLPVTPSVPPTVAPLVTPSVPPTGRAQVHLPHGRAEKAARTF